MGLAIPGKSENHRYEMADYISDPIDDKGTRATIDDFCIVRNADTYDLLPHPNTSIHSVDLNITIADDRTEEVIKQLDCRVSTYNKVYVITDDINFFLLLEVADIVECITGDWNFVGLMTISSYDEEAGNQSPLVNRKFFNNDGETAYCFFTLADPKTKRNIDAYAKIILSNFKQGIQGGHILSLPEPKAGT